MGALVGQIKMLVNNFIEVILRTRAIGAQLHGVCCNEPDHKMFCFTRRKGHSYRKIMVSGLLNV